jgi:hypothetical protein
MFWPTLESVSISQSHPDGITTFEADVPDPAGTITFEDDDEVRITFEGVRIWAGMVRATNKTQLSEHGPRVYELTGQDYTAKLDDSVIGTDTEQHRQSVATRVAWILTHLDYPGMTTDGVDLPDEIIEAASYGGMTVREALDSVADEMSLFYYVDYEGPSGDLHMFREEILAAPFDLDDTAPDYSTSFPYSEFSRERDTMELTNAVKVIGKRHTRTVTDEDSIAAYGRQESIIVDDTLRTAEQVRAAGRRRLLQLAEPIVDGSLVCWEPGLHAGMRVGIVNDLWGIDSNFIVTGVDISAVDPHDDDDKALLRSEVRFTDRRRVGRFPGAGRHKKSGNKKDDSTAADVGTCCAPVGIGEETLTEATQDAASYAMVPEAGLVAPPVDYEAGDTVILFRGVVSPDGGPSSAGHRVTVPAPSGGHILSSGRLAVREDHFPIDGSEPALWTVEAPTNPSSAEGWIWHRIRGFTTGVDESHHDDESTLFAQSSVGPDDVALGYSDTSILYQRLMLSESTDDEGYVSEATEPSGSGLVGSIRIDGGGDHGEMWLAVAHGPTQATDPATFDDWVFDDPNQGDVHGVALRVGSPYTGAGYDSVIPPSSAVTVTVLPVGPWEGGNVGVDMSIDPPAVSVDAGVLVLTSDETGKDYWLQFDGPPDMPTELDDFTLTVPFELDVAGSLSDPNERYVGVYLIIAGQQVEFYARLGDAVRPQGVLISAAGLTFVAKDITEGAQSYLKMRLSGGVAYAKMWSGTEPSAWDVTTSDLEPNPDEDFFALTVMLGNDGAPAQELRISPLLVSGGALAGEAVDWHIVGYGDGTETTFETPYAYDELSLQVRVDSQVLQGAAIADMDGAGAAFTLSRAPYGDPSDATGSSVVEAKYVRS